MQHGLLHLHNVIRWLVLLFVLITLFKSASGISGKRMFSRSDKRMALLTMIMVDVQLLLGLSLYYMKGWFDMLKSGTLSMGDTYQRFWAIEHLIGMLVAIILVHIAYSSTKKDIADGKKFRRIFWFTFFALVIMMVTIPWPFREIVGRPLFPGM